MILADSFLPDPNGNTYVILGACFFAVAVLGVSYDLWRKSQIEKAKPPEQRAPRPARTVGGIVAGWLVSAVIASIKLVRIDNGKYTIYIVAVFAVAAIGIAISIYVLKREQE